MQINVSKVKKPLITLLVGFQLCALTQTYAFAAEKSGKPYETQKAQPVIKVLIKTIIVTGNSLLTQQEVDSVIKPYQGKELSFEDAQAIAAQLTQHYRAKGYFLVQAYIPYQRIANNTLQVNVLEGKIGQVTVEGNKHYSTPFILYNFRPAIREKTLRYDSMEKTILLLNEFPDLKVQTVLAPGKAPGTTDVTLKVEDKQPNHIDVDYNNFGTLTGGENQPSLSPSFGNVVVEGDLVSLTGLYPFPSRSTTLLTPIFVANYSIPVNNHGTKIKASYSSSDVRLGQSLDVLNVIGNTNITTIGVSQPLGRAGDHSSNFVANFNIKSAHNFVLGTQTSRDKIRSISLNYNTFWVQGSGTNLLDATITQGLGTMFFGSPNNDPLSSTPGAGNRFTKLAYTLERFQSVGTHGHLLILKVQGQAALNPLLTPEQFIVGGPESVRGYRTAELASDAGVSGTIEFRIPIISRPKSGLQYGIFIDGARTNAHTLTAGTPPTRHLVGWGMGLRANSGDSTSVRIDFGIPLNTTPNSTNESPVLYFDFSTRFL